MTIDPIGRAQDIRVYSLDDVELLNRRHHPLRRLRRWAHVLWDGWS